MLSRERQGLKEKLRRDQVPTPPWITDDAKMHTKLCKAAASPSERSNNQTNKRVR